MSEMKYLMLFEAFESSALSKMMAFLAKKTDSNSKERFRDKLKTLITQLDIPIDKIKDSDIKYLNRSQALKLKSDDDARLYCLKFWFSIDEGYLGFTGTGNLTMNFNEYISGSRRRKNSEDKNSPFSTRELDYIKNDLDIKTGSLEPVKNYENIQHGQLVIGIFSDDEDNLDRLGVAKIWRDENQLYAIQNVTSGGSPDNNINGESWRDWGYRYSWSLDSVHSPGSDHCKLHIYTPSDEPIHVVGVEKEVEVGIKSPFDFNLPLTRSYSLSEWGDTSWSIDDYKLVEKSDFAIVLMVDDIIKSVEKRVTQVRTDREESRQGATKLMSDSQIKKLNIERYLTAIVGKMGIGRDIKELKNLQRLVVKSVCGDLAFISIYKGRPGFDSLDSMSGYIYDMMKSTDEGDRNYYLSNIIGSFKGLSSYSEDYTKQYNESLKEINNSNIEPLKEVFKIFIEIGKKIKNYLLSQNIQTIEDLGMIMVKLKSIRNLTSERGFSFNYTRNFLNDFHDTGDIRYYLKQCDERRSNEILEDIKKAKHLERYVDSLLR